MTERQTVSALCPAGDLLGITQDGVDRFAGIPYAHPPVGRLRFAPAVPLAGWEGARDATRFGLASAQVYDPVDDALEEYGEDPEGRRWIGQEDSLTLNIWRPSGGVTALPVIIWIHGGANWLETSRCSFYDGTGFAKGGAVFVSLNYRLGVFGFLDLSPIGGPDQAHSNGLTDQMAAIEWVVANIAAFGGDPANITLMGNSAGSIDISWHLASGRLPGGVRRLVMSSGVAAAAGLGRDDKGSAHDPAHGRERATEFLAGLGYASFADLLAAPTGEILTRQAEMEGKTEGLPAMDTLFYPRTGAYSALDPFEAAAHGAGAGREVMIGFTEYEMGLWLAWDDGFDQHSPEWAAGQVPHVPADVRAALPAMYRQWLPDQPEGRQGMYMIGDAVFGLPSLWFADLLAASGAAVHTYRFDWQADARWRALHCADIAFFFGTHGSSGGEGIIGAPKDADDAAARQALTCTMMGAVLDFATTGTPRVDGRDWPRYTPDKRRTMLFDAISAPADDPLRDRRTWWTAHVLPHALGGGRPDPQ